MYGIVRRACCSRSQRNEGRDASSQSRASKVFASTSFSPFPATVGSFLRSSAAPGSLGSEVFKVSMNLKFGTIPTLSLCRACEHSAVKASDLCNGVESHKAAGLRPQKRSRKDGLFPGSQFSCPGGDPRRCALHQTGYLPMGVGSWRRIIQGAERIELNGKDAPPMPSHVAEAILMLTVWRAMRGEVKLRKRLQGRLQ